ncbi:MULTISPECIES: Lrp/AsnC family transcriptional regulator [Salipiger]|uniref:Transcriptional regulator, AsnC family protein n=1 Tax=Salipiger bermudensis (strain DSM 26914 / JCM 13377 / KCTC 12554 / HTCC2601) TaxID=314265 RepID=Q0FTH7_SALBH|nr:Lrp/AsnC family transcriptional regulator [Salipiger bermudensis]MAE91703.1 Lrp/AsnC family transcriptional regulator [Pelagibaca sp.]MBR9894770.1 Lrp/AsnC family transcriptional regulator [bacterium]EAU47475.1 transcriptional regulator, AsnC family protein [Salipiger bermudensis HTCC2601]MBN9674996.1 Lrp/AsnC family transcriptional regulator [Salipiger bermudensis]MCA1284480.1 Lrp/AsnC family transcriptional regulator [Salipiger bermudensis]
MQSTRLDHRDIAILATLSREGRIAKTELAARVNLSPTPCWERMKRLEKAGYITGYRAEIDLAALGAHVQVFVTVELESHKAESFQLFERTVARMDQITGCWAIGGGYDYLMQVVTTDVATFQEMMDGLLESRAGVRRYYSYIVTKPVKADPPAMGLLRGAP